jgi:hypothetical protein
LGIGFIAFFIFSRKNISTLKQTFLIITAISAISIYIYINELYLIRESRFSEDYELNEEGRFIEFELTLYILNESPSTALFGVGSIFDEKGKYGFTRRKVRPMHGTYSRILFGAGYIGLGLFFVVIKNFFKTI